MGLIMGIDTGGTYTDAVILEYSSRKILYKAKALTTKEDLAVGIRNCLQNLSFSDFADISLVSLSTTLATNAIVEGRGCKTGLILIGSEPEGKLPAEQTILLRGKFDIKGRMIQNLEDGEISEAIEKLKGKVDAVAVSGYASVRNPQHELYIKNKIRERLHIPVVCAHELTSSLGFYERTITAILNASLIPIIDELIAATKKALLEKGVKAPIMIVKGDGSLMHESQAKEKPIETILSGPAASIIGGTFLTDQKNAIILDMGGTTTDIAYIKEGNAKIRKEGANVGGWLTRVKAADICTFGIGGDSWLHFAQDGQLEIGPQKVWPLSIFGKRYPDLVDELMIDIIDAGFGTIMTPDTDFYMTLKIPVMAEISELDRKLLEILADRPHNRIYLTQRLGQPIEPAVLQRLVDMGAVARISMTPTDILHAEGRYNEWDRRIAEAGVRIYAEFFNQSIPDFLAKANDLITNKLYCSFMQSLSRFEKHGQNYLDKPIVALGGPVSAWMQKVADKLNTTLIIPEHSEVANAVGAAVGQVVNTVEVLIRPDKTTNRFIVYAPWERVGFDSLEEAAEYAVSHAKEFAAKKAEGTEGGFFDVFESREDVFAGGVSTSNSKTYVETRIKAVAVEKLAWRV